MAFRKFAFPRTEHEKICKAILGKEYEEVNRYMDGRGGYSHRYKHGHSEEAEKEIRKKFGEEGVKAFWLHLILDDIQDKLPQLAGQRLKKIERGEELPPYFENTENLYCRRTQKSSGADPNVKILSITRKCPHCGKYIWCTPGPVWRKFE